MEYMELMAAPTVGLRPEEAEFKQLHFDIISKGVMASDCIVDMCVSIKKMRDEELYLAAGFETFEDYTESALKLKRRQAYYYISIATNLSKEFVQSNARLGVSKLALIASMSERDRDDMVAEHGEELEELTVDEVAKIKAEYDERIKQMQMQFDEDVAVARVESVKEMQDDFMELEKQKAQLRSELALANSKKNTDIDAKSKMEITRLEEEKSLLEAELKLAKDAPPKIAEDVESKKKLEDLSKKLENVEAQKRAAEEKQKQAEAAAIKAEETAKAEVEKIEKALATKQAEIDKQSKLSDSNVVKFKTLFDVAKTAFEKLLEQVNALEVGEQKSKFCNVINKFCDNVKSELAEAAHE